MSAENIVELTALTRKFWSFELILYFHLQNYIVDKNNISAECGNIPGCWKSLFQCHLATYNYGKSHFFFHGRPWQNLSCSDLRISNDDQNNQLPGDDLISLLCGIVSTDRELTRSISPIVFHQSTIPRGLCLCVIKRKRWSNSCILYYPNSDASFNIVELCIILSGDIHPLPVQDNETRKTIFVCVGTRHRKINPVMRGHNCTSVPLLCVQSSMHGKPLFLWKLHPVVLAMNNFELDTAVDNYGLSTLRGLNIANEPCVVAIQWKQVLLKIRKRKWFKCRVNSYSNSDATFNVMKLGNERSGDVHPKPGPSDNCTSEITVRISSRGYNNGNLWLNGTSLCNRNMTNMTKIQRKAHCLPKVSTCCLKFCLINTRSVRNKTMVVKDFVVDNDVDILALTETWLRP